MPRNQLIQLRRGTAAEWTSADPILADGEVGHETDTGKQKVGNGTQPWSALSYINGGGGGSVNSVNGQSGIVVLDTDDISEGSTNLYDKTVTITAGTNIDSVTGTYPNFTINASNQTTLPAGSNTQVQYNDSGSFGAEADFTYDTTNNLLNVGGIDIYQVATNNFFVGDGAGNLSVSGTENFGVGSNALSSITSGNNNTALGNGALASVSTEDDSVAIGANAATLNNGRGVVAIGGGALASATSVTNCVAIGLEAGTLNTANNNVFLGALTGDSNTTGADNLFLGGLVGRTNQTGSDNVLVGSRAGPSLTNRRNVGIGSRSLNGLTSGEGNMSFGFQSAPALTTGDYNIEIGFQVGFTTLATGDNNILIGYRADTDSASTSSSIVFGREAVCTQSNEFVVGSSTYPINSIRIGEQSSGDPLISGDATEIQTLGSEKSTGSRKAIETITAASDTLDSDNYTVLCDTSSNAITINLPASTSHTGRIYNIKIIDATNNVTIDPNGSETIDGSSTLTLSTLNDSVTIQCDGSNWYII